jgi:hypothetical protein
MLAINSDHDHMLYLVWTFQTELTGNLLYLSVICNLM